MHVQCLRQTTELFQAAVEQHDYYIHSKVFSAIHFELKYLTKLSVDTIHPESSSHM